MCLAWPVSLDHPPDITVVCPCIFIGLENLGARRLCHIDEAIVTIEHLSFRLGIR